MTYKQMNVTSITPNPDQPRKHFDQAALDELAASIASNGLLEPIVVRKVGNSHQIIAGERRWRASQIANISKVPVRIMDVDDRDAYALSVAENVNREDMNPMEEANAFRTMMDYDYDLEQTASMFGKSTRFIGLRLELLKLTDEIQALVADGQIKPQLAAQIAQCTPANQQSIMFKVVKGDFINDNEALHFAYALHQAESQESFFDIDDPGEEARERRTKTRKLALSILERSERAATVLSDLAAMKPEELAEAFANDSQVFAERLDTMKKALSRATTNARLARGIAEAQAVVIREAVSA